MPIAQGQKMTGLPKTRETPDSGLQQGKAEEPVLSATQCQIQRCGSTERLPALTCV